MNPGDTLDMLQDWGAWLGASTIASVAFASDTGMSVASSSHAAGVVTAFVHMAPEVVESKILRVACTITTADATPRVSTRGWIIRATKR